MNHFDELMKLHERNPALFEERKRSIIREYIDNIDDPERRQRALQIQWVIDGEMRKEKTPEGKYNRMVLMFWDQVSKFQEALKQL